MEMRVLAGSALRVSRMGLGLAALGRPVTPVGAGMEVSRVTTFVASRRWTRRASEAPPGMLPSGNHDLRRNP